MTNKVNDLIDAAQLADGLDEGEWIFCWLTFGEVFVAFAEQNKGYVVLGARNENGALYLRDPA